MPEQKTKKIFYASSLSYPSRYANRLQTMQTAEALAKRLGDRFMFGCNTLAEAGSLYTHEYVSFGTARSPILAYRQLRYVLKNGFDVVYCREHPILFMMYVYNHLFFKKQITFALEVHDTYDDFRFAFMLRRVAIVFCVTAGLARDLKSKFNVKVPVIVLPNAVNRNDFRVAEEKKNLRKRFGLPDDAAIVSYVGSVGTHDWKGVDVFLESYRYLTFAKAHYVIAGVRDEDLAMFRNTYTGKRITFFGWLSRAEIAQIMALSDALVLPNKKGTRVAEQYTSPLKLFEYMASGRPIIASDLPSTREILDERGALLVPPNDPIALACAVKDTFTDSEKTLRRVEYANKTITRYSWDSHVEEILDNLSKFI